ncbi:MAG TPA: M20/M25/M40 family metallo-hydrolase, partial [Chitinophagales bacterium]|nr:M20/M25/M40 family metallo-hydrolase [Chitinophagales bacterium]
GLVGFRSGMYMASCDELYITVKGKGGHAAIPAGIKNPLYIASDLLLRYQKLAEAFSSAAVPTVLQFGKLTGLGATNVVPDTVRVEGTFRTMEETWRQEAHQRMLDVSTQVAKDHACEIDCHLERGYPHLKNDEALTQRCRAAAEKFMGNANVTDLDIRMASEDFSYYSQVIPACFFRLGTGNAAKGISSPVHTATFDIDERALEIGAGLLAFMTTELLTSR